MLVLADTNIWITHFRTGIDSLAGLMEYNFLACHPLVIGELATGNLAHPRDRTISDFQLLPMVSQASFDETLLFLEKRTLYGRGLQWNDVAILAAVVAADDVTLWTFDHRLAEVAEECGVRYSMN